MTVALKKRAGGAIWVCLFGRGPLSVGSEPHVWVPDFMTNLSELRNSIELRSVPEWGPPLHGDLTFQNGLV